MLIALRSLWALVVGLGLARAQATYLTQAFAVARKNPRIELMLWFLVEPGDVDGLAAKLALLATDPDLRARMGSAGRERMRSRYAVDRLIDDIDHLYRDLLERKGIGPESAESSAGGAGTR